MNIHKQIFRNAAIGWTEIAVRLGTGLVIIPLLLARLGKESYGVWMLVGVVVSYMSLLDLGVGSSMKRFVSKYSALEDNVSLSRTISSGIFLFSLSSVAVVIVTLIILSKFSAFFNLSAEYVTTVKWLVLLVGLGLALSFLLRIGQGMLEGANRFDLIYLFRGIGPVVKFLLIIIFFGLLAYRNLILLAVITIVATIIPFLFMCVSAWKRFSGIVRISPRAISFASLKEIWSLSSSTFLMTLAILLFKQAQVIGVGKVMGAEAVALYVIPIGLLTYGSEVTVCVVSALSPLSSRMSALDEKHRLKQLNINGTKINLCFGLFFVVMSVAFGGPFLRLWLSASKLSEQDFVTVTNVLIIMTAAFCIGVPQNVTNKMLLATGRHWFSAITSTTASIVGLVVGLLLMIKAGLGLYGMALGWATVWLITGVLVFPAAACYYFKMKPFRYIRQSYLPPLAAAAVPAVTAYIIRKSLDTTSLVPLLFSIGLCLAIYAIAVYFVCFDQKQKIQIWSLIRKSKTLELKEEPEGV